MKMNYLLRNKPKSGNKKWRLQIALAILLFILIIFAFRTDFFRETLNKTALPFWKFDNYATDKFSNLFSMMKSKKSLILENRRLNEELNKIKSDLLVQNELRKENDTLKSLLGREGMRNNLVLSAVLVKPGMSPFDIIIIDIGREKGVRKGDRVLYGGDVAIGEVEEAYANSSKVKMYSSPGEKFLALLGPKSLQVEAEGLGGGNFAAKLPREVEVSKGDAATVPSISTSVFGFVEKIESNPSDSFQKILFKSPINLNELKWVEVEVGNI